MKKCKKCGNDYEGKKCKPCANEYQKKWRALNKEKVRETRKKIYQKNKKKIDQKNNEWVKNNRERSHEIKRNWKLRNRENYLEQQREYARKRYEENAEDLRKKRNKQRERGWYLKNRSSINERILRSYHEDPKVKQKYLVRGRVRYALQSGKLVKPERCSDCGEKKKLEAHHEDYTKPLDVIWLCRQCHKKLHRKYKD